MTAFNATVTHTSRRSTRQMPVGTFHEDRNPASDTPQSMAREKKTNVDLIRCKADFVMSKVYFEGYLNLKSC